MPNLVGKRVLVVEDEFLIAEDIVEVLNGAGAILVGPFAFGAEAKKAIEEQPIDLAVLDVIVRDGVSYPVASMLTNKGIQFIFASAQEPHREPAKWYDAPWLAKPYRSNDIVRMLTGLAKTSPTTFRSSGESGPCGGYHTGTSTPPRDGARDGA